MIVVSWVFDIMLVGAIVWSALRALDEDRLFKSIVFFIVFGLLMGVIWVRLSAPDVAIADVAIGTGITGALLLDAAGHIRGRSMPAGGSPKAPVTKEGEAHD